METVLRFRIDRNDHEKLQLIADAETQGNLSELIRQLAKRVIEERTRRRRR